MADSQSEPQSLPLSAGVSTPSRARYVVLAFTLVVGDFLSRSRLHFHGGAVHPTGPRHQRRADGQDLQRVHSFVRVVRNARWLAGRSIWSALDDDAGGDLVVGPDCPDRLGWWVCLVADGALFVRHRRSGNISRAFARLRAVAARATPWIRVRFGGDDGSAGRSGDAISHLSIAGRD